jgi:hypothetical protein
VLACAAIMIGREVMIDAQLVIATEFMVTAEADQRHDRLADQQGSAEHCAGRKDVFHDSSPWHQVAKLNARLAWFPRNLHPYSSDPLSILVALRTNETNHRITLQKRISPGLVRIWFQSLGA